MIAEPKSENKISPVELLLVVILLLLTVIAITPPTKTPLTKSSLQIQKFEGGYPRIAQSAFIGREKMVMSWKEKEM